MNFPTPRPRRRGSILIFTLVVVMVVATIGALLTARIVRDHRQADLAERTHQAELLADAGMNRALGQLARDPAYGGETWEPAGFGRGGEQSGRVTIAVEDAASWTIRVSAEFPRDAVERASASRVRSHVQAPSAEGDTP